MLPSYLHGIIAAASLLLTALVGCVQAPPQELLEAVESLDRQLGEVRSAEFAPDEYTRFARHWVAIQRRLQVDEDVIRWPWELNAWALELQELLDEGSVALSRSLQRRETRREESESRLAVLEERFRFFNSRVEEIESRLLLGKRPAETDVLLRQARTLFSQGLYEQADGAVRRASRLMDTQAALLTAHLGHYADEGKIRIWQSMASRTVQWSRFHGAAAIVVSKADHRLVLYRHGRQASAYPIRLGYNGMLEKRYQGDGATPEGQYRIIRKRDRGETQFYRALVLDYPNQEDRRRFHLARLSGMIPETAFIGGQIEIHGGDDSVVNRTMGCIMLENAQIDSLFSEVDVGTPVTIIGAMNPANSVALALAALGQASEEI
jgi:hypothetical protein